MKNKKLTVLILGMIIFSAYYLFKVFSTLKMIEFAVRCSLLVVLIWLTIKNIKEHIFEDTQTFLMMGVGIFANILIGLNIRHLEGDYSIIFQKALFSIMGIIVGGGTLYIFGKALELLYFRLLRKPAIEGQTECIGGGDVKLMAGVGAFIGPSVFFVLPFWICVSIVLGIIYIIVSRAVRGRFFYNIPSAPIHFVAVINLLFFQARVFDFVTLCLSLAILICSSYVFSNN